MTDADGRNDSDILGAQRPALLKDDIADSDILTNRSDMFARRDFSKAQHCLTVEFGVLDGKYGISACRKRRSSHDAYSLSCFNLSGIWDTGEASADDFEGKPVVGGGAISFLAN